MFKIKSRKPVPGKVSNSEICRAIAEGRLLRCVYVEGEERVVEPHCHGHGHDGNEVLSVYQISETDTPTGWKMFEVSKLVSVTVAEESFTSRPDFNPEHPGMTQVHCKIHCQAQVRTVSKSD